MSHPRASLPRAPIAAEILNTPFSAGLCGVIVSPVEPRYKVTRVSVQMTNEHHDLGQARAGRCIE
jgi:hypothetical protein